MIKGGKEEIEEEEREKERGWNEEEDLQERSLLAEFSDLHQSLSRCHLLRPSHLQGIHQGEQERRNRVKATEGEQKEGESQERGQNNREGR